MAVMSTARVGVKILSVKYKITSGESKTGIRSVEKLISTLSQNKIDERTLIRNLGQG